MVKKPEPEFMSPADLRAFVRRVQQESRRAAREAGEDLRKWKRATERLTIKDQLRRYR